MGVWLVSSEFAFAERLYLMVEQHIDDSPVMGPAGMKFREQFHNLFYVVCDVSRIC